MSCSVTSDSACLCLTIHKDTDFTFSITVKKDSVAVDVTGWDVYMDIRAKASSTTTLVSISAVSGIVLTDPLNGVITFTIGRALTDAITEFSGIYDIRYVESGDVKILVPPNKVKFIDEITQVP